MNDAVLASKIDKTKKVIDDSKDLSPDEKEALHDSVDQAAATANGSEQKLHDLTVSHCKSVLRAARFEVTFKGRVIDAVSGPLADLKDELVKSVGDIVENHVSHCPMKGKTDKETTLLDVAKAAVTNKWFCIAIAIATFSPNIVGIVGLFRHVNP